MKSIAKSLLLLSAVAVSILIGIVSSDPIPTGPSIVSISPEQVKNISESVELNCTVENVGLNSVFWMKKVGDGFVPLSMGSTLSLPSERLTLTVANNSYVLKFQSIEAADASTYTCEVTTSNANKLVKHVQLLVRTPPKISESLDANQGPYAVGQNAEINCLADGFPRPTIHWEREDGQLLPGGGVKFNGQVLPLKDAQPQDRGQYFCVADNGYGVDRKAVSVDVKFAPIITTPRSKVAQAINYDMELECQVEAFPAPSVAWYKDGNQLENNDDYSIQITSTSKQYTQSVLHIKSVQRKDYGDYECRATNSVGQADTRFNLYSHTTPNINFAGLSMASSAIATVHRCSALFVTCLVTMWLCGQ